MTVAIFPGQGSQSVGMKSDLMDKYPEYVEKTSDIMGIDVKEIILKNPDNKLNQTQFTQPLLFLVNTLAFIEYRCTHPHKKFSYFVGHSLGEFNALLAAGAFDYEQGLNIVKKRAELMSEAKSGAMAAVIGLRKESVLKILSDKLNNEINIANYNAYEQIVISGSKQNIEESEKYFEQQGVRFIMLNVSGAFHSPLMNPAQNKFKTFLDKQTFKILKTPVISNFTSTPYGDQNPKELLLKQLVGEIKWVDTIEYLIGQGENDYIEMGPGNILSGLINKIKNYNKNI